MISSTDYDAVTFKKDFCDYIQNAPRQVITNKILNLGKDKT